VPSVRCVRSKRRCAGSLVRMAGHAKVTGKPSTSLTGPAG